MTPVFTLADMPDGVSIHRTWTNEAWHRHTPSCVVAIPACNEATRIGRCLASLSRQQGMNVGELGVLVLVNGTTDATFRQAVTFGKQHALPLCVVEADLPPLRRDAGASRCLAIHLAMQRVTCADGVVFSTDADSVVPTDWVRSYRALIAGGCDVIAGITTIHEDDACDMPRSLRLRDHLECRYEACLDALESWLDPIAHDPWPRHYQASGANLALRRSCLETLARVPWPASSEDKMLVEYAEQHGLRVRHDISRKVLTSGRLFGRARGGMADTMRRRILDPESPCDERLEAVDHAYFRARTRRLLRIMHGGDAPSPVDLATLAARLYLSCEAVNRALEHRSFAMAWAALEQQSPRLAREPLRPGQLAHQCARGEALLAWLGVPAGDESDAAVTLP